MTLIPSYKAIAPSLKGLFEARENDFGSNNLLNLYFVQWDFDEEWYLSSHSDLTSAIPSKDFPSGFSHFRAIGYVEGRLPIKPDVDSTWYMENYPDVAAAILKGTFENARQHFLMSGYLEGRLSQRPDIDAVWYARNYLPPDVSSGIDLPDCIAHFKSMGYVNGAVPRLKKP